MDILEKLLQSKQSNEEKINYLREFLQVLILRIIYNKGYFGNLSFVGGTALRLLYDLKRFSEDLDFSLIEKKNYKFNKFSGDLYRELENYGFKLDINKKNSKIVQTIDLKFKNILHELNLSPIKSHKILIRLEIDTNPPKGWTTQVTLINKTYIFTVTHFDLSSLYALKLHACFYRKYTKGRDFYDLIWYLSKKSEPNYLLLNNAIKQTEKSVVKINKNNFTDFLCKKIEKIDFKKVKRDVERFLEDKNELRLFDKNLILNTIKSSYL